MEEQKMDVNAALDNLVKAARELPAKADIHEILRLSAETLAAFIKQHAKKE